MSWLGEQPDTIFLGQGVDYGGSALYETLKGVDSSKKLELPVAEDMQGGMSIGLSLSGYIPISVFPRFDFLLLAVNQLVNHLDKIEEMSHGEFSPKVIIRTAVGRTKPLYPGLQHCGDYTDAFRKLLKNVKVVKLNKPESILPAYMKAYHNPQSTLLIEVVNFY